eukprot:3156185-Prorocentrum_lima.AAC.1
MGKAVGWGTVWVVQCVGRGGAPAKGQNGESGPLRGGHGIAAFPEAEGEEGRPPEEREEQGKTEVHTQEPRSEGRGGVLDGPWCGRTQGNRDRETRREAETGCGGSRVQDGGDLSILQENGRSEGKSRGRPTPEGTAEARQLLETD